MCVCECVWESVNADKFICISEQLPLNIVCHHSLGKSAATVTWLYWQVAYANKWFLLEGSVKGDGCIWFQLVVIGTTDLVEKPFHFSWTHHMPQDNTHDNTALHFKQLTINCHCQPYFWHWRVEDSFFCFFVSFLFLFCRLVKCNVSSLYLRNGLALVKQWWSLWQIKKN